MLTDREKRKKAKSSHDYQSTDLSCIIIKRQLDTHTPHDTDYGFEEKDSIVMVLTLNNEMPHHIFVWLCVIVLINFVL